MKIRNKKRVGIIAALLVLGVGGIGYAVTRPKPMAKVSVASTPNQASAPAQATQDDKLAKPAGTTNASGDPTTSATTSSGTKVYVIINRPVNNDTVTMSQGLQLRATITGASTGSCALTLTGPSGQNVSKSADFTQQTSYASCAIDVAGSQLAAGQWSMSLTATSGGTTTSPITQKVTVQ